MSAVVARARGLATRRLERVDDTSALEALLRERGEEELVILGRWADEPLTALVLDEDRRSLRALVRGLAAGVAPVRRVAGTIPTATLPATKLVGLSQAASLAELVRELGDHPLAAAIAPPLDLFAIEHALVRRYCEAVRGTKGALGLYIAQVVDVANAITALLLAARASVDADRMFIPGGARLDRATFLVACTSIDLARERLARAFAKTPIASALFSPDPAAIEDAALAWQLATQTHLRLVEPLGLAAVVLLVLKRRAEARQLRRAAWRLALGGGG